MRHPTKWSNTLKHGHTNCLSVFDPLVVLAHEGLIMHAWKLRSRADEIISALPNVAKLLTLSKRGLCLVKSHFKYYPGKK